MASRTKPEEEDTLGAAKQTTGQHQGRCLVNPQPVPLRELHLASQRTERRVHLTNLYTLSVALRQKTGQRLGVTETGWHPTVFPGRACQNSFLLTKVQPLNDNGPAHTPGVFNDTRHGITYERLALMPGLAVGHQGHPEGIDVIPAGVRLADRQMVRIEVYAGGAASTISVVTNTRQPLASRLNR